MGREIKCHPIRMIVHDPWSRVANNCYGRLIAIIKHALE
jgi:hypothetical protein